MVKVAISALSIQDIVRNVTLDQVVQRPLNLIQCLFIETGADVGVPVFNNGPKDHRGRGGHREVKLHVVAGVQPSAGQVLAIVALVVETGVGPPRDWVRRGEASGALGGVELDRLVKHLLIIVCGNAENGQ